MKTCLTRFSPLDLKTGKTLRNRIVIPPMASETADTTGQVTDKTLEHYQRLSAAHAGLLIVEYTFVHPSGRSEEFQLGIQSDAHIEGLSKVAQVIRKSGALAGIQLSHGGGKSERNLTGGALQAPSAISIPVKDQELEVPDAMNLADLETWKSAFIAASDRAVQAGFDLVEFHSAHGYGLNQWLSPITNQRIDSYGMDLRGRMRLLIEIVEAVRIRHPQLLLSVRLPGQDFLQGGLKIADTIAIAQSLESLGVDILHISSGIGGWRRPSVRIGEGYLVQEAEEIQRAVKIPVIGVGGIQTGAYINQSLNEEKFQLAAVGRAILKDPAGWFNENLSADSCSAFQ